MEQHLAGRLRLTTRNFKLGGYCRDFDVVFADDRDHQPIMMIIAKKVGVVL